MKKLRAVLGIILSMGLLVQTSFGVLAANESSATNVDTATDANFTNLIVFARFAGEEEFVNKEYHGLSVKEITDNSYNTATYSVGDYYRNASADQLRMNSVYQIGRASCRERV